MTNLEVPVQVPPRVHVLDPEQQLAHEPLLVALREEVRDRVQDMLGREGGMDGWMEGGREGGREGGEATTGRKTRTRPSDIGGNQS